MVVRILEDFSLCLPQLFIEGQMPLQQPRSTILHRRRTERISAAGFPEVTSHELDYPAKLLTLFLEGRGVINGDHSVGEPEFGKFAPAFGDDEGLGRTTERVPPGAQQVGGVALGVADPGEDLRGEDGGAEGGEGGG